MFPGTRMTNVCFRDFNKCCCPQKIEQFNFTIQLIDITANKLCVDYGNSSRTEPRHYWTCVSETRQVTINYPSDQRVQCNYRYFSGLN